MQVQLLTQPEDFEILRDEWNALTEECVYPNIFTIWDWQTIWWKWFSPELNAELFILTVREKEKLIGIVPFYRQKKLLPLCFGKNHLQFIGYGGRICPEYLGPVIRQGQTQIVCDAVVQFLKTHSQYWDSIFVEDYALDDSGTAALAECLKKEFAVYCGEGEKRYIIPLFNTYEDYLKSLNPHNRQRKRSMMNQAKKRYNAFAAFQSVELIEEWFPNIVVLTTDARKRKGNDSPFLVPAYANFHKELLQHLLPKHKAGVQLVFFNNHPVSCWYVYFERDKTYAYSQGSRSDVQGSPGEIGTFFLLEELMNRKFTEFDFLRGGESYKTSYTDQFRSTEWLYIFRKKGIAYWTRLLRDKGVRPIYWSLKSRIARIWN
jgi:hypothetical protein